MQIDVHGRHLEVDEELRTVTTRKVEHLSKYLSGMEHADVTFSDGNGHASPIGCEMTLQGRGGMTVRASAAAQDPVAALDQAVERASVRLTRLKKRLVSRSRPRHKAPAEAPKKALEP